MSVLSILDEIAATASKLEKEAILRRNKNDDVLQTVINFAYNPFIRFYIAKDVTKRIRVGEKTLPLEDALYLLESQIARRKRTGQAAIDYVAGLLGDVSDDDAVVLMRVILKDLRAGFSESTANKVWKDLVPVFDVMTCHSDLSRIKFPAYSQLKADGVRCHLEFNEDGEALAYARSGNLIDILGALDGIFKRNMTLDGELVCYKNGKPLDRKTSNGIINKAIKGTISKQEAELIHFLTWDIVDITSKIPYQTRLGALRDLLEREPTSKIIMIPTKIVHDDQEALDHFRIMRGQKLEGTIVKNIDHKWVPKRSYDLCKMKDMIDIEMECIGYEEGKKGTKNEGKLGALVMRDADHKIECSVGTGIEQRDREADCLFNDEVIGSIWTVRYNERITSKDKKRTTESLFLPRIIERRLDKTKPNTYAEILALEKLALETKLK